jgi:hypothetical protein
MFGWCSVVNSVSLCVCVCVCVRVCACFVLSRHQIMTTSVLLLQLQMILGSVMRRIMCFPLSTANSPHTHWRISFPTYGIADSRFVITCPKHVDLFTFYKKFCTMIVCSFLSLKIKIL